MFYPPDPSRASGETVSASPASDFGATVDRSYAFLVDRGLSPLEAGNVVAFASGLHPVASGWTVDEIKDLTLIRGLVACRVIEP
jgi:hypothetical protein